MREQLATLGVNLVHLTTDSRALRPGDTFVAYPGEHADGRRFIEQALANGANAVIWEAQHGAWDAHWQAPNLAVAELRQKAGEIADAVYGQPSQKLWMVGITGTNGKTSCCHWIAQVLAAQGRKTALIGTLGNGYPGALEPSPNTTPDAIRVHGLLADYLAQGAQAVAMEVSSHALQQGRVNAVQFDVALFTNLSRDHLDYHGNMDSYAAAKRRLFDWHRLKFAVINLDDTFGATLAEELQDEAVEVIGYGLTERSLKLAERLGLRMVYGSALRMETQQMVLQVHSSWGAASVQSSLVGRFNAANLLGVLAVALVSDIPLAQAVAALAEVKSVAGRMQRLGGGDQPTVVVDYAHTPDALEKVLLALREVSAANGGKLGCVFGCGGDRDRGKRPMMGRVAEKFADWSIVTSDNPRSEAPQDILREVLSGMSGGRHEVIEDRAAAISAAVSRATSVDTLLIAGKGHEMFQEIGGVKHPFSDLAVVEQALAQRRAA
ncbi:MAG: UDP-N-acetylmuramoyl-L-alanyl-D-glutamate--2,6-diaminopimelate ligase [Nitrosomonadales bacterium]|nr:UDP-N-acetylmuramoyl-L-alanyl-D-glutamate--2,6-diaminopimelate ligase [Nitrosomonadales bacterium]